MTRLYLRSAIWDYLLVLAASCGFAYILLDCFYADDALHYSVVPGVICAVTLLALFAASVSRKVLRVAGPLLGLVVVASWVVAGALTPDGAIFVDNESNYLIFVMCSTLTAIGCYLLSRSRLGCALLFIAGSFTIALVQFLYGFDEVWATLVFVFAALALLVFRNYQLSLKTATGLKKVAFAPGFAVAALTGVVAVALGAGAWFGIIAPLNPPAAEVKLISEHRALETVLVKGIADIYQVPNLDMTSDQTNDEERTTDDIKESEDGRQVLANGEVEPEDQQEQESESQGTSFMGIDLDNPDDTFDFISYLQRVLPWAALVVALQLVAYFVGRRLYRKRRLDRVMQLEPSEQVLALYPFFMKKLRRLGISIAPGQTLAEYAVANASTMEVFDNEASVSFAELTDDYVAAVYGGVKLDETASGRVAAYYRAFWKAARRKLGAFKYFFKSFRL